VPEMLVDRIAKSVIVESYILLSHCLLEINDKVKITVGIDCRL
jgi:hypothetical protein